jgi:hypothetical protein
MQSIHGVRTTKFWCFHDDSFGNRNFETGDVGGEGPIDHTCAMGDWHVYLNVGLLPLDLMRQNSRIRRNKANTYPAAYIRGMPIGRGEIVDGSV